MRPVLDFLIKKSPLLGGFLFCFSYTLYAGFYPAGLARQMKPLEIGLFLCHIGRIVMAAKQFSGSAHQIAFAADSALSHIEIYYIRLEILNQVVVHWYIALQLNGGDMVIMFGVPTEYFENVKMLLFTYNDLIAETKVSKGTITNVFPEFTEEIPAKFFHLQLKGDIANPRAIAEQFAKSLTKALEMYMSYPGPKISIFDRDSI